MQGLTVLFRAPSLSGFPLSPVKSTIIRKASTDPGDPDLKNIKSDKESIPLAYMTGLSQYYEEQKGGKLT